MTFQMQSKRHPNQLNKTKTKAENSQSLIIEFKIEFTENLQAEFEFKFFIFNLRFRAQLFFLSSSNFCQVLDKFKTQSTFCRV